MPLLGLLLLFIAVPLAELYVILQVGEAIGAVWTILLLAADSVLGSVLLRSQGRAVWRRFNEALAAGRMPHREVQAGVAVIFGGAFLITPGFLTDIVGLALLLPPTRALILRFAGRLIAQRMAARITVAGPGGSGSGSGSGPEQPRRTHDVEGTATEHEASEQEPADQPSAQPPRLER